MDKSLFLSLATEFAKKGVHLRTHGEDTCLHLSGGVKQIRNNESIVSYRAVFDTASETCGMNISNSRSYELIEIRACLFVRLSR